MKKIIFLFAIIAAFSFTASAQFSFIAADGTKFSSSVKPDKGSKDNFEYYYSVEGSDVISKEIAYKNGLATSVYVEKLAVNDINLDGFQVKQLYGETVWVFSAAGNVKIAKYSKDDSNVKQDSGSGLSLLFQTREAADAFKEKIAGKFTGAKKDEYSKKVENEMVDKSIGELDLSLGDEPATSDSDSSDSSSDDSSNNSSSSNSSSNNSSSNNSSSNSTSNTTPKKKGKILVKIRNKTETTYAIEYTSSSTADGYETQTTIGARTTLRVQMPIGGKVYLKGKKTVLLVVTADMEDTEQVIFK